jgi:hypothetical protein
VPARRKYECDRDSARSTMTATAHTTLVVKSTPPAVLMMLWAGV